MDTFFYKINYQKGILKIYYNYLYIYMNIIIIQILLISLCATQVIVQSNPYVKMSSPGRIGQSVVQTTKSTKIPQAPNAVWIWSRGWDKSTCVNPLIIQGTFLVQSGNPITFYVGADDYFKLFIDGTNILEGSDYQKIYQTSSSLTCGMHTFKIIANNAGSCTQYNHAGLIYAFVQDTSTFKECYQKLPLVSNTQLKVRSSGKIGQLVLQTTKTATKILQAPNAVWIWSKGCVSSVIIQGTFLVQSGNPITFYITADEKFQLFIDGNKFLEGNDWVNIYSKSSSLSCGFHAYKIIANNFGACNRYNIPGLIFAFVQDTSTFKPCYQKLPLVSNTEIKMSSTFHIGQSVVRTSSTSKIPQAPNAVWIWSKNWDTSTCANPLIIQGTFLVQSLNPITFYMTADDEFQLFIDGSSKLKGSNWRKIFQTSLLLSCGMHPFKIIAYNYGLCTRDNFAGLIYAFVQDTSTTKCSLSYHLLHQKKSQNIRNTHNLTEST